MVKNVAVFNHLFRVSLSTIHRFNKAKSANATFFCAGARNKYAGCNVGKTAIGFSSPKFLL